MTREQPLLQQHGPRVLVIDDEQAIGNAIRTGLHDQGSAIVWVPTAREGIEKVMHWHPDVIILDLTLPDLDGIAVCQRIRTWTEVPIIVLSVRDGDQDKVAALDSGADDYLTKPFSVKELQARVRVALRHAAQRSGATTHSFHVDDLVLDFTRRQVSVKGEVVHLRPIDYEVLKYLAQHAGQVVTHRTLLRGVWGPAYGEEVNYLRVCVARIRQAIEPNPGRPHYLLTNPGIGYRLCLPEEN